MWTIHHQKLVGYEGSRHSISSNASPLSFGNAIQLLVTSPTFRAFLNKDLSSSPYSAFRWETPAISTATFDRDFEFVTLNSPHLDRPSDQSAFAEHFQPSKSGVVTFSNLGGDATLVVPTPLASKNIYGHLANFIRQAPVAQIDSFWQAVGVAMRKRLSTEPVWLSTAGAGVSWLHVRLDNRPKYYGYGPYRSG